MGLHDKKGRDRISMSVVALATTFGICIAAPAVAQEVTKADGTKTTTTLVIRDVGGAQRVNISGRLRMLSQRISAAACILDNSNGADGEVKAVLENASNEFNHNLTALRRGDAKMGIFGGEKSFRIYLHINDTHTMWDPLKVAVNDIVAGQNSAANTELLAQSNINLLEQAKSLVSTMSNAYSNPAELTGANALLIDYSGRQRMLLQRIAKESCGVTTGNVGFGSADKLAVSLNLYEATLLALKDGFPNAGILPPPTEQIRVALETVFADWQIIKGTLSQVTGPNAVDQNALTQLFSSLSKSTADMDVITGFYSEFSKSKL